MATVFHYLPYLLGAGLAALALFCFFDGSDAKKRAAPRRPKQIYYRWDDKSVRRD